MKIIKTSKEISEIIDFTIEKIKILIDQLDFSEQTKNNFLYKKYSENKFHYYVEMEINRYIRALEIIKKFDPNKKKNNVSDYGCMIPFLPLALSTIGYRVNIIDKYDFYGEKFKNVMNKFCLDNKLNLIDKDIINDNFNEIENCDIAINLAVVEHLNGSPKKLMKKIRKKIRLNGLIIFDVPNIVNFVKRIRVLMGYSPLDNYKNYFDSPYPYMGHNREMTVNEVKYLMSASGFDIKHIETYDFNHYSTVTWKGSIIKSLKPFIPLKNLGECILAVAKVNET